MHFFHRTITSLKTHTYVSLFSLAHLPYYALYIIALNHIAIPLEGCRYKNGNKMGWIHSLRNSHVLFIHEQHQAQRRRLIGLLCTK